MNKKERAIVEWLATNNGGISSKTLAFRALGVRGRREPREGYPHDPSDLRLCLDVEKIIGERKTLAIIREIFTDESVNRRVRRGWVGLHKGWAVLRRCYNDEVVANVTPGRAPRTYDLMRHILASTRAGVTFTPADLRKHLKKPTLPTQRMGSCMHEPLHAMEGPAS